MFSNNPEYITSHLRDRTPSGVSLDRARHQHDLAARHGRGLRVRFSQYIIEVQHQQRTIIARFEQPLCRQVIHLNEHLR